MSPPLREQAKQSALWRGLAFNDLQCISTDHCPFCMKEQKELGIGDFSKIPNGIGSVEHRLDLLYQGVVTGEITLERWVELCSTTPARMFGLYGRKGVIEPGADADIVVYDPEGHTSIGLEKTHHMNMDHSAWEGFEIDGHVDLVMSRGTVVISEGEYRGTKGHGQYLKRGLSQYLL
jgi:dihydropyrimidinase